MPCRIPSVVLSPTPLAIIICITSLSGGRGGEEGDAVVSRFKFKLS
jgi:hypothetical protein